MANKNGSNHPVKRAAAQEEKKKTFLDKTPAERRSDYIKLGIIAGILILVIVLAEFDFLPHLNGSMNYYNETIRGLEGNEIIVDKSSTSKHKYFKLGTYEIPAEYQLKEDMSTRSDKNAKDWYIKKTNEDGISYIYISGVSKPREDMLKTISGFYVEMDNEGNVIAEATPIEGKSAKGYQYKGFISAPERDDYNNCYNKYASAYVEARKNCCVLVSVITKSRTKDGFAADEVLVKYLEDAMSGITLE